MASGNDDGSTAVVAAIDSIINETQTYLQYPCDHGDSPSAPSFNLNYRFNASLSVSLDTEWSLFPGLVLENVSIATGLQKQRDKPAVLSVRLSAFCRIEDRVFMVSGAIPSLNSDAPVEFPLSLRVADDECSLHSSTFLGSLTGSSFDIVKALGDFDSSLSAQIMADVTNELSWTGGADLLIVRNTDGTFAIKSVRISFAADVQWEIIPNCIKIHSMTILCEISRETPSSPWLPHIRFDGTFSVPEDIRLCIHGEAHLGVTKTMSLGLSAGIDPANVLEGSSLPPSFVQPTPGQAPFEIDLKLSKQESAWCIESLRAKLSPLIDTWGPMGQESIFITSVFLLYRGEREAPSVATQSSMRSFQHQLVLGGAISFFGAPFDVTIVYQGTANKTTLLCRSSDQRQLSLQDVASDSMLNPDAATSAHNLGLVAQEMPVAESVPIDLAWCGLGAFGNETTCILDFRGSELERVRVRACYVSEPWQIAPVFPNLKIANLGILFDITNPLAQGSLTSIRGYAYGTIVLDNKISIFAFISGSRDPFARNFEVRLSASIDPTDAVGVGVQSIFADSHFLGTNFPTDGWMLPPTVPSSVNIHTILQEENSIHASMALVVSQTIAPAATVYQTRIEAFKASLSVQGSWEIIKGVSLRSVVLGVIVLPPLAGSGGKPEYRIDLTGCLSQTTTTTTAQSIYMVEFAVSIQNSVDHSSQFEVAVAADSNHQGDDMRLSQLLAMDFLGLGAIDVFQQPATATVPTEQLNALANAPAARCSLMVQKTNEEWDIERLEVSAEQHPSTPRVLIQDILEITQSRIDLLIKRPRTSKREIRFFASATVKIGSIASLQADISVTKAAGVEDTMILVIRSGPLESILQLLVGSSRFLPEGCPVMNSRYHLELEIVCKRLSSGSGLSLTKVSARVEAQPDTSWLLGGLNVTNLHADVTFDQPNTPQSATTIQFKGRASISNIDVQLAMRYSPNTISVTLDSAIQPTAVVGAFIPGGLDAPCLNAPLLPEETGLAGFRTRSVAGGELIFKYDGAWKPDSFTVRMLSSDQWMLAKDRLKARDINLDLSLTGLSSPKKKLCLSLGLTFEFKLPPPSSAYGALTCSLTATERLLQGRIDTSACTLPRFLYVATAGRWVTPDWLDFPAITPDTLRLKIDVERRKGEFVAQCRDWSLVDTVPRLASIKVPSLRVSMVREKSFLSSSGELTGTAIVLGAKIPVSYELAKGPFRLFGIDVREAYKLTKKLYQFIKDTKTVVELVAQLAELEGVADAAAGAFAALTGLGIAKLVAQELIDEFFSGRGGSGSGGKPPENSQDDFTRDSNTTNPAKASWLTLGGTLQSPGPPDEIVDLYAYPKDKYSNPLLIDPKLLFLTRPEAPTDPKDISCRWTAFANGYRTTVNRPIENCTLAVQYRSSYPLEARFENVIHQEPSKFSLQNSLLQVPETIPCGLDAVAVFVPCDQYQRPRRGPGAAPPLQVTFATDGSGSAPRWDPAKGFALRNDCLLLQFRLTSPGTYTLSVSIGMEQISISFQGKVVVDPAKCVAFGPGLCSGPPGQQVTASIKLLDQNGSPFVAPNQNDLDVDIILTVPSKEDSSLVWSLWSDTITTSYTRPDTECTYTISILINGIAVNREPTEIQTTTGPIYPDLRKSVLECWSSTGTSDAYKSPVFAAGDRVYGLLTMFDNLDRRYRDGYGDFVVSWPPEFQDATIVTFPNGVARLEATIPQQMPVDSTCKIVVTKTGDPATEAINSPFETVIVASRQPSSVTVFGSGLSPAHDAEVELSLKGFDQYGEFMETKWERDCRVFVYVDGSPLMYTCETDDNTIRFRMPPLGAPPLVILVKPIGDKSNFRELLFVVPTGPLASPNALGSFIIWDQVIQAGTSRATLYVVDSNGHRYYRGGAFVQILSDPQAPSIIVTSISDNFDGSYTFEFLLPPEAFTLQSPYPSLRVLLDNELVGGTSITFPMQSSPGITAVASGCGISSATLGRSESFSVSCLDSSGQLTSVGFHSASAYIIRIGAATTQVTACTATAIQGGQIGFTYLLPPGEDNEIPCDYHLHVSVNSRPLLQSPFQLEVKSVELLDVDEAWKVTRQNFGDKWSVTRPASWFITESNPATMRITDAPTHPSFIGQPIKFILNLPSTEEWFYDGFAFQFNITIDGGPLELIPSGRPIFMRYTASHGGECQWVWRETGEEVAGSTQDLIVAAANPTTLCFVYFVSRDGTSCTIHIFHGGRYIASDTWIRDPIDLSTLPRPSFSISRVNDRPTKIFITNPVTVPSKYPINRTFRESATELMLSTPWVSHFFDGPCGGTLTPQGLEIDGQSSFGPLQTMLRQMDTVERGSYITVYTFTLNEIVNWRLLNQVGSPGQIWFQPLSVLWLGGPQWFNPGYEQIPDPVMVTVDPMRKQTVIVISGAESATAIANGVLGYVNVKTDKRVQPQLGSSSVKMIWNALRAYPPLERTTKT